MAKTVSEFECVAVKSVFTEDRGCGLTCEHAHARAHTVSGVLKTTPSCVFYSTGLLLYILNCVLFQLLSTILSTEYWLLYGFIVAQCIFSCPWQCCNQSDWSLARSIISLLDPSCNKYCNLIGHCECSILLRKPCNHLENHVTT